MRIYLVRHGDAVAHGQGFADRPLSDVGHAEAQRVAEFLKNSNLQVKTIFHSGKARALQTAEHMAAQVKHDKFQQMSGLKPMDDPIVIAEQLKTLSEDVMLVAHLPFISSLLSLLVTGDAEQECVLFNTVTTVCLESQADKFVVRWVMEPQLL